MVRSFFFSVSVCVFINYKVCLLWCGFVNRLWSHLAENFNPSTSSGSPNLKSTVTSVCNDDAMGKKWRTSRSRDLQNQATVQSDKPLVLPQDNMFLICLTCLMMLTM